MARTERFNAPPHAAYVSRNNRPLSMMDRQLAALRLRDEAAQMRITTEQEAVDELTNFSLPMEVDDYGYPLITPYMVPDSVPDVSVPATQAEAEKTPQNSVSNEGSVSEPSGGTE